MYGAAYANVQPHSGAQANAAVYLACMQTGDTMLGFDLSHGGHLTHALPSISPANTAVLYFMAWKRRQVALTWTKWKQSAGRKPKMIICGASAYARDWDYARFRAIADKVGPSCWPMYRILRTDREQTAQRSHAAYHIVTTTPTRPCEVRRRMIPMGQDFENPWGSPPERRYQTDECCAGWCCIPGYPGRSRWNMSSLPRQWPSAALTEDYHLLSPDHQ